MIIPNVTKSGKQYKFTYVSFWGLNAEVQGYKKTGSQTEIRPSHKLNLKLIYSMIAVQNAIYKSCCIDSLLLMNGHG